ncbi:MAG: cupin domain-containing protein [Candidatus Rokuibacteriota bacterium]
MKIRLRDHVTIQADKMAKVLLAATPRALVDLYCLAPGQAQKPHAHADQDKLYVVLEGQGHVHLEGTEEAVAPGEIVVANAGAVHGVVNTGREPLILLVVVTPPPPHA